MIVQREIRNGVPCVVLTQGAYDKITRALDAVDKAVDITWTVDDADSALDSLVAQIAAIVETVK